MKTLKNDRHFRLIMLSLMVVILVAFQFGTVIAQSTTQNSTLKEGETLDSTGFFSGDSVRVNGNVNGTAFVAGNNLEVTGDIDGDLFVAGQSITVTGNVTGSVFTAGQDITVSGNVENNIYSAGNNISLESTAGGTVFAAGQNIFLKNGSNIARDAFIGATNITADGNIGGCLSASGEYITVLGSVGKNASLDGTDIKLDGADIKGNLKYTSKSEADISGDTTIGGKTDWKKPATIEKASKYTIAALKSAVLSILGALLIWFVVKLLRPLLWTGIAAPLVASPLKTLGIGFIAIFLIPIISIILLITVVGIPLSLVLIVLYFVALYLSKIVVAVFIGEVLRLKFKWPDKHKGVWLVLLGLVILTLLGFIPYVGALVIFLTLIAGIGAMVSYVFKGFKTSKHNEAREII